MRSYKKTILAISLMVLSVGVYFLISLLGFTLDFSRQNAATMGNGAKALSVDLPQVIAPGQSFTATVVVENTGQTIWTSSGQYFLGSADPQGNSVWGINRVPLSVQESIAPGQRKTFTFTATAPSTPGGYSFQWQMVQEGVEWFGTWNPLTIRLIIQPPTATSKILHFGGTATTQDNVLFRVLSPYYTLQQSEPPYLMKKIIYAYKHIAHTDRVRPPYYATWNGDTCAYRNSIYSNPYNSGRDVDCVNMQWFSDPAIRIVEREIPHGLPTQYGHSVGCETALYMNVEDEHAFACAIILEEGSNTVKLLRVPWDDELFEGDHSRSQPHTNPGPYPWILQAVRPYLGSAYNTTTDIVSCFTVRYPNGKEKWNMCRTATAYKGVEWISSFNFDFRPDNIRIEPGESFDAQCFFYPTGYGDCGYSFDVLELMPTPAPTVSLSVSPNPIPQNTSTRLTWSSTNATSCQFSGGLNIAVPTSQSVPTGNLTQNTTYTLTCTGPGGSVQQSVTVQVLACSAVVSGKVFQDTNGNGIIEGGESLISGQTVILHNATASQVLASTTTQVSGGYSFTGLSTGTYRVTHEVPLGFERTTDSSAPFTVCPDFVHNFGIRPVSSKAGDLDGDNDVDIFDYNRFVSKFGQTGTFPEDLNANGKVDIFDYNILVTNFGK